MTYFQFQQKIKYIQSPFFHDNAAVMLEPEIINKQWWVRVGPSLYSYGSRLLQLGVSL